MSSSDMRKIMNTLEEGVSYVKNTSSYDLTIGTRVHVVVEKKDYGLGTIEDILHGINKIYIIKFDNGKTQKIGYKHVRPVMAENVE